MPNRARTNFALPCLTSRIRMNRNERTRIKEISHQILPQFLDALPKLSPVQFRAIEYEALLDKKRILYRMSEEHCFLDKLLSLELLEKTKSILPKEVMSFQKGKGPFDVVHDVQEWMKNAPRDGLFVMRTDIRSYTDSIPVRDSSPLWVKLESLGYHSHQIAHFKSVLRPLILADKEKGETQRIVGIPTGLALTPVISNLYGVDLDQVALSDPDLFYRRYGDDIILGAKDARNLLEVWPKLEKVAKSLSLEFHPEKTKRLLWSRNGFTKTDTPEFKGTQYLDFLGFQLQFKKGLRLNAEKMQELRTGWVGRILRTRNQLESEYIHASFDEKAKILVQVTNEYFSPQSTDLNGRIHDLYQWVDDQGQLKELEDFTARVLTQTISGIKGCRAYSKISWKELIEKWNWKSPRYQWICSRIRP